MATQEERYRAEGASAERSRIKTILSSPYAAKYPTFASDLAFGSSTAVEAALEQLRGLAEASRIDAGYESWEAIVDRQNAEAGLSGSKASAATDPWSDTIESVNRENGR